MTPTWLQSESNLILTGVPGLIIAILLIVWWRERSRYWVMILPITLGLALVLTWSSARLFVVPDYQAGCTTPCNGWRGFPAPTELSLGSDRWQALSEGQALNILFYLDLLLAGAALLNAFQRAWQTAASGASARRVLLGLSVIVLWGLTPRYITPPEPAPVGEPQRLAINGKRLAGSTVRDLPWQVQRFALEDVRPLPQRNRPPAPGLPRPQGPDWRVCLRGYTFFYLPWQHIYIDLDSTGTYPIGGGVLPLDQACWSAPFPLIPSQIPE